jgi:hypothetical protein
MSNSPQNTATLRAIPDRDGNWTLLYISAGASKPLGRYPTLVDAVRAGRRACIPIVNEEAAR